MGWVILDTEPLKLTVHASQYGYSGNAVAQILRQHQIECEYADPDYLVLMFTPENNDADFARIKTAFGETKNARLTQRLAP